MVTKKPASPRSKRAAVSTDRRLQALELRKTGMSFQAIGDRLAISKEAAWQLVDGALTDYRAVVREAADEVRELELLRLDELTQTFRTLALTGDTAAATTYLKTMERRARLLGLDAAARTELTGRDGGPLQSVSATANVNLSALSLEQLLQLDSLMNAAQTPGSGDGK
ncbi:hypothetical protein RugamoR57_37370 [Duganella caerulea]|uniref:hypothetical protein n=1 Tax=Duganella caerulea TaxID=2885762 RepID=UPI0030E7BF2C